ncbi:MAG TPA: hypothetical protein VLK82_12860 [Candidatus Tectomicrobia bacterium]|nr:hypothetical protein [Candidatus Tectomicrobia bacterium]
MGKRRHPCVFVMLALMASAVIAVPPDLYAAQRSGPTAVAISDVKNVAGRWSGILYGRPGGMRGQDWVELALHEDGTYTLASARTIGVFTGSGKVSVADGRLVTEGGKAQATITLYQRDGKRFLRVEGSTASGQPLRADLYPAP